MSDPTNRDDLADRIGAFLATHHVMSLATTGPEGAHAANLLYAYNYLSLIWVSEPDTRHSCHIETDPRVTATVSPNYTNFTEIIGLQIAGEAHRVGERARDAHLAQLETRYPFLRRLAEGPAAMQAAYARIAVYRLQPSRIVFIDNTRGFGHKETLDLGGARPAPALATQSKQNDHC